MRTRVRVTLHPVARITTLIALSLLAVAAYYLAAPVFMETSGGWYPCGRVISPPPDEFTVNTCQGAPEAYLAKAVLAAAVALIVGVGGVILFGVRRRTEQRRVRVADGRLELR